MKQKKKDCKLALSSPPDWGMNLWPQCGIQRRIKTDYSETCQYTNPWVAQNIIPTQQVVQCRVHSRKRTTVETAPNVFVHEDGVHGVDWLRIPRHIVDDRPCGIGVVTNQTEFITVTPVIGE